MGKNRVVEMLQNAHLYNWIGDYREASLIMEYVKNSDEKMVDVLRLAIEKKEQDYRRKWDSKTPQDQLLSLTLPTASIQLKDQPDCLCKLKFSVVKALTLDSMVRLEIRAFNPNGGVPNNFNLVGLSLDGCDVAFNNTDNFSLLKSVHIQRKNSEEQIFISIDRWGLISGAAVGSESEMSNILGDIYCILGKLEALVWKQE